MPDEMTFAGAPDSETLLLPAEARGRVSRQEFVNLMVIEYIDRMTAKIGEREVPQQALAEASAKAIETAYVAWREEIKASVLPRIMPWHAAVTTLLGDDVKLSEPYCSALAVSVTYTFSGANYAGDYRSGRGDDLARLVDLFNRILHRKGVPTEPFEPTGGNVSKVDLARARMMWSFLPIGSAHSQDAHYTTITHDIRPSEAVRALILAAVEAGEAFQAYARETRRMQEEIADGNITKLEKRALSKLTRAALAGEALPVFEGI